MKIAEHIDDQDYYSMDTLVAALGITPLMFSKHERHDVGQISKAREVISGLGIRYKAKDCRKYISLVTAGKRLREKLRGVPQKEAEPVPAPRTAPDPVNIQLRCLLMRWALACRKKHRRWP